jgi:hypothetical protein
MAEHSWSPLQELQIQHLIPDLLERMLSISHQREMHMIVSIMLEPQVSIPCLVPDVPSRFFFFFFFFFSFLFFFLR